MTELELVRPERIAARARALAATGVTPREIVQRLGGLVEGEVLRSIAEALVGPPDADGGAAGSALPGEPDDARDVAFRLIRDLAREGDANLLIEPTAGGARVRLRRGGPLEPGRDLPTEEYRRVVEGIFRIASLERGSPDVPQDGQVELRLDEGRTVSVWISTAPDMRGTRLSLRVRHTYAAPRALNTLGLDPGPLEQVRGALEQPGTLLIAGPHDSGRTTTLYAMLAARARTEINAAAAEDHVERLLSGVAHLQARPWKGLTLAGLARTLLRQGADVLMLADLRDYETLEVCTRAALGGRTVLGAIAAEDAASVLSRLTNMGLEPYQIADTVTLVVAQRLLRTVCPGCRTAWEPSRDEQAAMGLAPELLERLGCPDTDRSRVRLFRGAGCAPCLGRGVSGLTGVFEVLVPTDELREHIRPGVPTADLARLARRLGMRTLREAGLSKALAGEVPIEDVLRATPHG